MTWTAPRREPVPPHPPDIQPWPGDPWCGRCKSRIREALAELDILAALFPATADGHRTAPGTERVSGSADPMSPSQAGDDLDELASMLTGWEDAYRDHMEWPSLARRGHLASRETECIAWLMRNLDEILRTPFAVDFGHRDHAVAPRVHEQDQSRAADPPQTFALPPPPVQAPHPHLDRRGHLRDLQQSRLPGPHPPRRI